MRARLGMFAAALVLAALLVPGPVQALPGPIQLVSKNALEQADRAEKPALSADGRYLAFRASIGGLLGVFRKDLWTDALEPVVAGSAYEPNSSTTANEPSISADGRFVSLTTRAQLDPDDDPAPSSGDVYVVDMSTSPPGYELASARDGCDPTAPPPHPPCGLSYGGNPGASASGRVSLSADGRKLVFVTLVTSNLTGSPTATETPEGEVALRDLDADTTTLVSVARDPLTGAMQPGVPVPGGAVRRTISESIVPGAALSADGTTVAWLGTNLQGQVPLLADEELARSSEYSEPLWRRLADGPAAPTRRVVGGGDPLAPGCPPGGTLADAACRGPFPGIATGENTKGLLEQCTVPALGWDARGGPDLVPQLSADGRTVALLGQPNGFANVFLVDMSDGLSRSEALSQLTRETPIKEGNACIASGSANVAGSGDVTGVAVSPAGDRVAFTTQRQLFPSSSLNVLGGRMTGVGRAELYLGDLGRGTLQRMTHGASEDEPSLRISSDSLTGIDEGSAGATAASFSGDGETLAFASEASNLVTGDANGRSDVFVVSDPRGHEAEAKSRVSPPPPPIRTRTRWQLLVSASSRPDGTVRVRAAVPGAGWLRVKARGPKGVPGPASSRVAVAGRRARSEAVLTLGLEPASRFRRLVRSPAGLEATLSVRFAGPGGKPLTRRLEVRFRRHAAAKTGAKR